MKLPFDIQPTTQNLMIIGLVVFAIYLNQINSLNKTTMLIISGLIIIMVISKKGKQQMIDIFRAKEIALEYLTKIQSNNEISHGTIKILPERELKSFLLVSGNPNEGGELISYSFHVLAQVGTTPISYYLVKIGIYGNIIGITEVLKRKAIGEIQEEITKLEAGKISTTEEFKQLEEEKLKGKESK